MRYAAVATDHLLKLLASDGPDAVMKAVNEELANDGPDGVVMKAIRDVLAGGDPDIVTKAVRERLRELLPPGKHSPVWELGFFMGTTGVAGRVQWAVQWGFPRRGLDDIEPALRRPYDSSGMK